RRREEPLCRGQAARSRAGGGHFSSRRRLSAPRARPGFGHSLVGCLATDARRTFASGWASSRTSFRDEPCKRCCLYADGGGARRPRSCRKACSFSCVCRHNPIIGIPAPWRRNRARIGGGNQRRPVFRFLRYRQSRGFLSRSSNLGSRDLRPGRLRRSPPLHGARRFADKKSGSKGRRQDRKSTRLNSSHGSISYAVFCLKKKKHKKKKHQDQTTERTGPLSDQTA